MSNPWFEPESLGQDTKDALAEADPVSNPDPFSDDHDGPQ